MGKLRVMKKGGKEKKEKIYNEGRTREVRRGNRRGKRV